MDAHPGLGELAFLWNANEPRNLPTREQSGGARYFSACSGIRLSSGRICRETSLHQNPLPEMHLEDSDAARWS